MFCQLSLFAPRQPIASALPAHCPPIAQLIVHPSPDFIAQKLYRLPIARGHGSFEILQKISVFQDFEHSQLSLQRS